MATSLQPPENFSLRENYACYRLVAELTLDEAVELIDEVILYCRRNNIPGILLDLRRLTGFSSPTVTDRFWYISKWAETGGGRVVVSIITRPDIIAPDKIGVIVATNRGMLADVFTDEDMAIAWLRSACR